MVEELIKKLLEAGVHFGHQTKRWSPKMKKFIFGQRSGIYIIDLEKTVECLNEARDFVRDIAARGGKILFIGTKKQSQSIIEEEADYWWLNANPKIWNFADGEIGDKQTYTSHNEKGNKRRIYKYFESAKEGDVVAQIAHLFQSRSLTDTVERCMQTADLLGK